MHGFEFPRLKPLFWLTALAALVVAGCGGPAGGVTLELETDYVALYPGETRTVTLTLTPTGGFGGSVDLELVEPDGAPAPAWVLLAPGSVSVSDTTTVSLTLQATAAAPQGVYALHVAAGGATAAFTLHVVPELGSKWTAQARPTSEDLFGVDFAVNPSSFVAVGGHCTALLSSDGGVTWGPDMDPCAATGSVPNPVLSGVVADPDPSNNAIIAVGYNKAIFTGVPGPSGYSWFDDTLSGIGWLKDIAYRADVYRFVTVGMNGEVHTSDDTGQTWTARTSGTTKTLEAVIHDGTRFIAVGDDGVIVASPDGASWSPLPGVSVPSLEGIAYGNGTYVAVASDGQILVSKDGANSWTAWDSGAAWLYDVAYGDGVFVAVGANGVVFTSNDDGAHWTRRVAGSDSIFSVAYGNGRFVAVGEAGLVLTSP